MKLDPHEISHLQLLIEKLVDNSITTEEHQELENRLQASDQWRKEYLRQMQFHSSIHVYADVEDVRNAAVAVTDQTWLAKKPFFSRAAWMLAFSLLVFLAVASFGWQNASTENVSPLKVVAIDDVQPLGAMQLGGSVSGPIDISQGLLTLATKGGSLISLEGPCRFKMTGENVGRLEHGNLVAFCGENAEKLTVDTPGMQYTDLGTEFGVNVSGKSSCLHVFDGLVMASDTADSAGKRVLVEAASSLRSNSRHCQSSAGLVDMVSFEPLRKSLAEGGVSEEFDYDPLVAGSAWKVSFHNVDFKFGQLESEAPLAPGLGTYLQLQAFSESSLSPNGDDEGGKKYASAMVSFDYSKLGNLDLKKAHTVECVLRLECDPDDVRGLMMFGGEETAWQKRAWELRGLPNRGKLMWSNYNPKQISSGKYQYLETESDRVYHLLIEIDPVTGRYRKTVSDGKNRVWSEMSDGSAAKLKLSSNSLGMVHWRIRGAIGKPLGFSIDAIRIRNRPEFSREAR